MAERQPFLKPAPSRPELDRLLERARAKPVTDAELAEQRASFVYGNAPDDSGITKDSACRASLGVRITR